MTAHSQAVLSPEEHQVLYSAGYMDLESLAESLKSLGKRSG